MSEIKKAVNGESSNGIEENIELLIDGKCIEIDWYVTSKVKFKLEILNNSRVELELDKVIVKFVYIAEIAEVSFFQSMSIMAGEKVVIPLEGDISNKKFNFFCRNYQYRDDFKSELDVFVAFNSSKLNLNIKRIISGCDLVLHNTHLLNLLENKNLFEYQKI